MRECHRKRSAKSAALFFFAPASKSKGRRARKQPSHTGKAAPQGASTDSASASDETDGGLPAPVTRESQDATTLRELKLAKMERKAEHTGEVAVADAEEPGDIELVVEEDENEFHVADG